MNFKNIGIMILKIILFLITSFLTFWLSIGLYFSRLNKLFYLAIFIIFIILSIGIWTKKNRTRKKLLITGTILIFSTIFSVFVVIKYEEKLQIKELSSRDILIDYAPFKETSKVAKLNNESSLKLKENLPVLDGATALFPVYSAFYEAVYPKEKVDIYSSQSSIQCSKTGKAYDRLLNGEVDIIFVAGPSQKQIDAFKEKGIETIFTPIGKEAFVFFVNKSNKVNSLTEEEIKSIYSGKIKNWKEVGGKSKKIKAYQRNEGSGSQSALEMFMKDIPIETPDKEKLVDLMSGIIYRVASYRNTNNAIGFTFRFYSLEMLNEKNIKHLSINGIEPTIENISKEKYPVTNVFYAVTTKDKFDNNDNIEKLIQWILSDEGQSLIEKTGYVPLEK